MASHHTERGKHDRGADGEGGGAMASHHTERGKHGSRGDLMEGRGDLMEGGGAMTSHHTGRGTSLRKRGSFTQHAASGYTARGVGLHSTRHRATQHAASGYTARGIGLHSTRRRATQHAASNSLLWGGFSYVFFRGFGAMSFLPLQQEWLCELLVMMCR